MRLGDTLCLRASLSGLSATKGVPPWILLRMWDSRLSARTDSGFHAADRLEVTKLGADLSKTHVHYKQRWTLPFDKAVNVTLSPRRSARINFPYGRHIRLVRILYSPGELHPGCPEGLPLVVEIPKRTATGPLRRPSRAGTLIKKNDRQVIFPPIAAKPRTLFHRGFRELSDKIVNLILRLAVQISERPENRADAVQPAFRKVGHRLCSRGFENAEQRFCELPPFFGVQLRQP